MNDSGQIVGTRSNTTQHAFVLENGRTTDKAGNSTGATLFAPAASTHPGAHADMVGWLRSRPGPYGAVP